MRHPAHTWIGAYYSNSSDEASELSTIVTAPLLHTPNVNFFRVPTITSIALQKINRRRLYKTLGLQSTMGALLGTLERFDRLLSEVAELPAVPVCFHSMLYGPTEFAHTPLTGHGYISINLAPGRVQDILDGVLKNDRYSRRAIADLLVHEKAHLSLIHKKAMPKNPHGPEFYAEKHRLKHLLLDALEKNPRRDPFRYHRKYNYSKYCEGLFTPNFLAANFPDLVCKPLGLATRQS